MSLSVFLHKPFLLILLLTVSGFIFNPDVVACNKHKKYIKEDINLEGKTLFVPENTTLVFNGGIVRNGKIVGNKTRINAPATLLFDNIVIEGTWDNPLVFSQWFHFLQGEQNDNASLFCNLMNLCRGESRTDLYFQEGVYYTSTKQNYSCIIVPSNLYWHNNATIIVIPNDFTKSALVLIQNCNNVIIEGGEFVGDVRGHKGSNGEWGHGVKVAGSSNVRLKDIVVREFWGDGIDLIEGEYVNSIAAGVGVCDNIIIDGVKCLYNRRQGLSIEAAKNVIVKNSEFAYTGKYGITDPGCGVDIEPWCTNEVKIDKISFYNCYIHDNHPKMDFCLEPNLVEIVENKTVGNTHLNNISINNCKMGKLFINGANTVSIKDSEIEEICDYKQAENIKMDNCTFNNKADLKKRTGLTLRRCK